MVWYWFEQTMHIKMIEDCVSLLKLIRLNHTKSYKAVSVFFVCVTPCLLFQTVPNMQGELCGHYPMKLIILEYEREAPADDEA